MPFSNKASTGQESLHPTTRTPRAGTPVPVPHGFGHFCFNLEVRGTLSPARQNWCFHFFKPLHNGFNVEDVISPGSNIEIEPVRR